MSAEPAREEIVGVVPAAGHATRLQPLVGSKEAMTVGGRPLLTYLLARMRAGGCTRIRMTTRAAKRDVIEVARQEGVEVVLGEPETVAASIRAALDGLGEDVVVLIGFPDTVWHPCDAFVRVVEAHRRRDQIALGLFPALRPRESDNVEVHSGRVTAVRVKPASPRSIWTWGIAASRVAMLERLSLHAEPGDFLHELAQDGRVHAVCFSGPYVDAGTPYGLARLSAHAV